MYGDLQRAHRTSRHAVRVIAAALGATLVFGSAVVGAIPLNSESSPPSSDLLVAERLDNATQVNPPPPPQQRFATLPPGSVLPSGAECANRVKPAAEVRPANQVANQTRGTANDARYPRVDGDFVGTTDEILQWAACKWGIDEDLVRAQAAKESWWYQSVGGDLTGDQSACHPALRTTSGSCPESIGILQVRYLYHDTAFAGLAAINSTAYNADYTYAVWRECFEGGFGWLNNQGQGVTYVAGDALGCTGLWFAGRWYTSDAREYIATIQQYLETRIWTRQEFIAG